MKLDEIKISRSIVKRYMEKLLDNLDVDVVIVGGGPAGMVAGYYLAKNRVKTVLIERKISLGGGMWAGGIMFNEIVVQQQGKKILDEFGINIQEVEPGYFCADAVECVSTICSHAVKAGLRVFNLVSVEDVMLHKGRVDGVVVNWTAVEMTSLYVDPVCIRAKYVIDATGHPAEIARLVQDKSQQKLATDTGKIMGERSMDADRAESIILGNTKEIHPGLFVAGMCANAVFGSPRMGPVFGGMLLSGKKAAEEVITGLSV